MAMRRLYDRYSGYATAIALRYIPNRDEMRDVLQDSFLKILTSVGDFHYRGEGSLKSWIARIVVNNAIDHLRSLQRVCFVDTVPDLPDEEPPDMDDISPDLLTEMIGQLPDNYRIVLNLFALERYSHKEIAQQLGIKESTSSLLFFRAKKMLSKMIQDYLNHQQT